MQDAQVFSQLAATLFLIIFSVGFGYRKLRYFGFGFHGLLERQVDYETRRRTRIGKKAHRPLLIRHAESAFHVFGLSILPTVVNGAILLSMYRGGFYALVPMIVIPLALAEFGLGWWMEKKRVLLYQDDYDRYMRLTHGDNRFFDGTVIEQSNDVEHILSGGRLIWVSRIGSSGQVRQLRLFVSFQTDVSYLVRKVGNARIRMFYRSYGTPDPTMNIVVHGELLGFQAKAVEPLLDPGYSQLEQRIAAKY